MLEQALTNIFQNPPQYYRDEHRLLFDQFINELNSGNIRACEKHTQGWQVHTWIKMGILIGFRMGVLAEYPDGNMSFFDKDTLAAKRFSMNDQVRMSRWQFCP
jgi:2,3,4,5-tetrahydropyridine-2-carboxylate N-succinyltransferase